MKPPPFRYVAPLSLDEAHSYLADYGVEGKLLAGGQSLIPAMNFRLARPAVLIDLNRVPGLDRVTALPHGGVRIDAMTRQRTAERSELLARACPLVTAALPYIAHIPIRNRGTVGGSLAHADPAAELPAVVVALDATILIASARGERQVFAEDFYQGLFTTDLAPEEMIVAIEVPAIKARTGWSIREIARRHGDYAMAGVAVRIELDASGVCSDARIVYFGVGEGPARAVAAERSLSGEPLSDAAISDCAEIAVEHDLDPHDDMHASAAFRAHLARVLGRTALAEASGRARLSQDVAG